MQKEYSWLLPSEAARRLGLSKEYVRQLSDRGEIRTIRASGGVRLLNAKDVEKLARARREK